MKSSLQFQIEFSNTITHVWCMMGREIDLIMFFIGKFGEQISARQPSIVDYGSEVRNLNASLVW